MILTVCNTPLLVSVLDYDSDFFRLKLTTPCMYADGNLTFASSYDANELIVKLMILIPLKSKNLVPVVTL